MSGELRLRPAMCVESKLGVIAVFPRGAPVGGRLGPSLAICHLREVQVGGRRHHPAWGSSW